MQKVFTDQSIALVGAMRSYLAEHGIRWRKTKCSEWSRLAMPTLWWSESRYVWNLLGLQRAQCPPYSAKR